MFEIRFESIGGLGAHTAGQVLATAAVLRMGQNGACFSSYGSEKKGSLVRSYVRLGPIERPIRTSAPIDRPDAIVVFHAALLRSPATIAGLKASGTFLFDSPPGAHPTTLAGLPRTARVLRVDALAIARAEKSRANAVLLGALTGAFPELDADAVLATLSEKHGGAANERAFRRGIAEVEALVGVGAVEGSLPPAHAEPAWGYLTQPMGGIVPEPGNMIWNDLSASRTGTLPVLDRAACIHCGVCDLVCPDYCLTWGDGTGKYQRELLGVDYRYCKGCNRCVESCPTGAMTREVESPGLADRLRVPRFPEVIP